MTRFVDRTPENCRIGARKNKLLEGATERGFSANGKLECNRFLTDKHFARFDFRNIRRPIKSNAQVSDATHQAFSVSPGSKDEIRSGRARDKRSGVKIKAKTAFGVLQNLAIASMAFPLRRGDAVKHRSVSDVEEKSRPLFHSARPLRGKRQISVMTDAIFPCRQATENG